MNSPHPDSGSLGAGRVQIIGVAFGGLHAVKRVEVSVDGGTTWRDASFFGPDLGKYAWRGFVLPVQLAPGSYTITSRATDTAGNVQPEGRIENIGGYSNASWVDHAVKVTIT